MSRILTGIVAGCLVLLSGYALCAQDNSPHFISAKAGMINLAEGKPLLFNLDHKQGKVLSARDQLRAGDRIQTEENGRVEILLNPGSYLRVAGRSEVQFLETAFDSMQVRINEGAAILESSILNKKFHALTISTSAGDVKILNEGLYRFQVNADQSVEVAVSKGKARWLRDGREMATLKSGKRYILGTTGDETLQVAKLDKNRMDNIDLWSKQRAEFLVTANDRLSLWDMDSAYSSFSYNYGYRGGWMYNPYFQCFTFVPFDYTFRSPYGYYYANYYPVYAYRGYNNYGYGRSGQGSSSASSGTSVSQSGNRTASQRPSVSKAPSSPGPRINSGRQEQNNRGTVAGRPGPQRR